MASLKKRGGVYYAQYYVAGTQKRVSLETDVLQIAKEKVRQIESALARDDSLPLPTRTAIPEVVGPYVNHIRAVKTAKSAQTDVYYLRDVFGAVCPALEITSRKIGPKSKKRPQPDLRRRPPTIEANTFEQITTADIAAFISRQVQERGLAPKTANRYREILCRLFNWATEHCGVRLPNDRNPAAHVKRYKEHAPEIRFLTLTQIDEQLVALDEHPQLQAMVATLIFAGLRREELLWLTRDDLDLSAPPRGLIRVRAKTIGDETWQPKTKVNRAVPVSSTLRSYLNDYKPRVTQHGWLFPSPDGSRWDPDNFSSDLRAVNTAAGLAWGCLDYRHTFGSQLAMKGESLYKISTLMGNSPEICRRHYAALLPESLTDAVEFAVLR